ncbi:MAG TPA: hypothetical protein VEC11_06605 [Allosphingosinicella sp.]|nr:hypothetical protein [Allosphingosinicella sp.]
MQRNFSLESGFSAVRLGSLLIDLHNLYTVAEISTDPRGETLVVRFDRDHGYEGPVDQPEHVTLRCTGDLRLAVSNVAALLDAPDELDFLIAYFDDDCGWGEFLDEDLAARQGFDGLHLGFGEDRVLRIRCADADITVG